MDIWLVFALVLFIIAAVMSALERSIIIALIAAGLACTVVPAAWLAIH